MSRWAARGLLSVAVGLVLAMAAFAQDVSIADQDEAGRQTCTARMLVCSGSQQVGGLGFVRVEIDGVDDRQHHLEVEIGTPSWSQVDIGATRRLTLGPHERARFFLPVPSSSQNFYYRFVVDGKEHQDALRSTRAMGVTALFVAERADAVPDAMAIVGKVPSTGGNPPVVTQCLPMDMPTDWRLFTAFHLVIVDGRAPVPGDVQEALRRYLFAGGVLVVAMPDKLPAGALRQLLPTGDSDQAVGHGLGAAVALPRLDCTTDVLQQRLRWLPFVGSAPWPGDAAIDIPQFVPGLGQPPVLVFLTIIIAFAVLAGPVNLIWSRRRRQPLLILITLPALGFGTTLAILAYGYLHDGVGVRGAEVSWSLLDQTRHEVATVASRTLFAGITPDDLQLGPDTYVASVRACVRSRRIVDSWRLDLDSGRLDGGVLPSRTPTPLLARQQGPARQRLRVRAHGDELELLVDGGVQPVGTMVLCDLDGAFWVGEAPRLRAATPAQAASAFARLRTHAIAIRLEMPNSDGRPNVIQDGRDPAAVAKRLFGNDTLAPGSYATMVDKAPWLEQQGLTVHYDVEHHFLLGRMQAEDFLR